MIILIESSKTRKSW